MAEHSCLNLRECEQVAAMLAAGQSKKTIARVLNRSARRLTRELKHVHDRASVPYRLPAAVRTMHMTPVANGLPVMPRGPRVPQPDLVPAREPCILIIDDDRDLVRALDIWLGSRGYETVAAYNGRDGLDTAIATRPDAIVLDIRMPGMDGLAILEKLRNNRATAKTPAIIYSGKRANLDEAKADAEKLGAFCYLEKPSTVTVLMDAVRSALCPTPPERPALH